MIIILNDAEMQALHMGLQEKYPWMVRDNTIYETELISRWAVHIDDKYVKDAREILSKNN